MSRTILRVVISLALSGAAICVCRAQSGRAGSAPVEQWREAVLSGDSSKLAALYAVNPRILVSGDKAMSVTEEVAYWMKWKQEGLAQLNTKIAEEQDPQLGVHVVAVEVTLTLRSRGAWKKMYVTMAQAWIQQGDAWRIAAEQRQEATRLPQPIPKKDLYPANVNAVQEIAEALKTAAKSGRRVLVVFGGNWCYDCHVLEEAFHTPEIAPTLNQNFVVVHVDVGEFNKNLELAKKYGVPLEKGVPAVAVLESDGRTLFSQKQGEFEKARSLAPEDVLAFLNRWKPAKRSEP